MRGTNVIGELTFDFSFASHSIGAALHEVVAEHARDRGVSIIDQVIDEFDGSDVIVIDQLDLDLGAIAFQDDEFDARFREELRISLRNALADKDGLPGHGDNRATQSPANNITDLGDLPVELDQLWHLLLTGQWPLLPAAAGPEMIDSLVDRVLAHHGAEIVARIRASPDRPLILARIARQWTQQQRTRLAIHGSLDSAMSGSSAPTNLPPVTVTDSINEAGTTRPFGGLISAPQIGGVLDEDGPLLAALLKASDRMPAIMDSIAASWNEADRTRLLKQMTTVPRHLMSSARLALARNPSSRLAEVVAAKARLAAMLGVRSRLVALLQHLAPSILADLELKTGNHDSGQIISENERLSNAGLISAPQIGGVLDEDGPLLAALLKASDRMPAIMDSIAASWNEADRTRLLKQMTTVPRHLMSSARLALARNPSSRLAEVVAAKARLAAMLGVRSRLVALLQHLAPSILADLELKTGNHDSGQIISENERLSNAGLISAPQIGGVLGEDGTLLAALLKASDRMPAIMDSIAASLTEADRARLLQLMATVPSHLTSLVRLALMKTPRSGSTEIEAAKTLLAGMLSVRSRLVALLQHLAPSILADLDLKLGNYDAGQIVSETERRPNEWPGIATISGQSSDERLELTLGLIEAALRPDSPYEFETWRKAWESGSPGPASIEALYLIEAGAARAVLRELSLNPKWIKNASNNADYDFWQAILAAWGSDTSDSSLILAVVTTSALMPTAGAVYSESAAALRAELLAILLANDGATFQSHLVLTKLVAHLAGRRGISTARFARALIEATPETIRARIRARLQNTTDSQVSADTPATVRTSRRGNDYKVETLLAAARWPGELWHEVSAIAPEWLADRLQIFATSARWREAFAGELNPVRVRLLLKLWMPQPSIEPLVRLLSKPEAWQTKASKAPSQRQIYTIVVTELHRSAAREHCPVQLIEAIMLAVAQTAVVDPIALSKAILAELAQDGADAELYRELSSRWHGSATLLAHQVEIGAALNPLNVAGLVWSLARGKKAPTAVGTMTDGARRRLYEALVPGRAAFVFGLLDRLSAAWASLGYESLTLASDEALLRATLFGATATLDPASLASAWAAPRLAAVGNHQHDRIAKFLASIADSTVSGRLSDTALPIKPEIEVGESIPSADGSQLPDGPFQPDWFSSLPATIPLGLSRLIAQSLSPPRDGMMRLRGLDQISQRQLLIRIDPDAAPALKMVHALDRNWREARLPEDGQDETEHAMRLVLRVLFEQRLGFDPAALTNAWLASKLHTLPDEVQVSQLWQLTKPGNIQAHGALEVLMKSALPKALRLAGVTKPQESVSPVFPTWPSVLSPGETSKSARLRIENAGLVLLAPYFQPLFERLELATDGQFVDEAAAERAVHILELLVDGVGEALDPLVILNKLICGIDINRPVTRHFIATGAELELTESLLEAVIQHWGKLGSTSVSGLREAFLQRSGTIVSGEDGWRLTVEKRTIDVLVDAIPWGFQTLKLPWMEAVLYVDWR